MSEKTGALTPLKSPIVFSNVTFKSFPDESFSVEIKDKTREKYPASLLLELTCSKLTWMAFLHRLQRNNAFNATAPKFAVVDVLMKWLDRESSGQEQQTSDCQVDLKQSSDGSMSLLIAIKDSESGIVHGYWWHLCPRVMDPEKSVNDMMEHLSNGLDAEDDMPELFAVATPNCTKTATFAVWNNLNRNGNSKCFELVEGGSAIKVLKAGQYKVEYCTTEYEVGTIRHEVYLESKCIHIYYAKQPPHRETKTLTIYQNSTLRLFAASETRASTKLLWILRRL
ncbi:hypothetical protein LEN26_001677 [Aphanomyces euteiches]|nr:hypothetical protein AeMF1_018629 [Aphanomyces euteiches]KAH9160895.1 hypothetical protein LEN26_001677 [Aphanomyces euteiches]KAH9194425.1 hypothetical protein AeNC1_003606 [Aphanomyces euteiches]